MSRRISKEQRIRQADTDESVPVSQLAPILAKKFRTSEIYAKNVLSAKRKGFPDYATYQAKNFGLSPKEYQNRVSQKRGYESFQYYVKVRKILTGKHPADGSTKPQRKFENSMIPESKLSHTPRRCQRLEDKFDIIELFDAQDDTERRENPDYTKAIEQLPEILNILSEKERYILTERFSNSRTLEDVGNSLRISKQAVSYLQNRAIEKIRDYFELVDGEIRAKNEPNDKEKAEIVRSALAQPYEAPPKSMKSPVSDGEILLAHILGKAWIHENIPNGLLYDELTNNKFSWMSLESLSKMTYEVAKQINEIYYGNKARIEILLRRAYFYNPIHLIAFGVEDTLSNRRIELARKYFPKKPENSEASLHPVLSD